jgi:acetyl esterase
MPLHPQCENVLRHVDGCDDIEDMSVAAARALDERLARELGGDGPPMAEVRDVSVAGAADLIPARVYRPRDEIAPGILVWLHGGGFVLGSPDGSDTTARALAGASGCIVVSVDYRLAPEHPFPAAPEDCYAATNWVTRHAASLGAAEGRVAVGGDSAGGNLAAVVALLARDRGGPSIDLQVLVYPVVERAADTPSYRAFAEGYWLTAEGMAWFWRHYLSSSRDGADPRASPMLATSLAGLPPAVVATAEYDVLRDEGERYADRLRAAGVPVALRRHDGMLHGFLSCAGVVDEAWAAFEELGRAVRLGCQRAERFIPEPR